MIRIYEQGYNDFSSNGLGQLHPTRCVVREQQGGVYDLEIDHPMDETLAYDFLKNGRIIKVPVPATTTPMHKIKGVESEEWWKADVDGKAVYSVKSTDVGYSQTVTKTKTVLTEKVLPRAAASAAMDMEYMGNHPRDTGVIYEKKPVTYTESEWVPGTSRVVDRVREGQLFLVLDKTDSSWWQVTTSRGQTGWMQTGGISHDHTVVGRLDETVQEKKIRDQLFRIYKTEKDTDAGEVRAWARHIYYDLLGNVVMEGVYKEVTLGDLLPQLEANCSQPGHGFQFHTDAPLTNLTELDYTHKNMVEAQLDPDDGVLAKGNLRMVRDNFDVYFTGRSQTKRAPITYGHNLLGVTLEIDEDGVVNRIVPIGSNKDGDPVLLDQKWVDSPNLAEGDLIRAKAIEYSEAREKDAREATENSPSEPAVTIADVKEMLLEKANEEYDKGIDLPDVELTVDFIQLGDTDEYQQFRELDRVYLSDLVQITDLVHGIDVEAEVTEYDFDCLTGRYTKIKVGVTSAGRTIGTVDGFMLPNGGVGGTKLARGGVDASRLQNLSITSAKIGVAQIQQAHIQDAAIDTAQIKNAAITTAKIGDAQVDTAQIKDAAIQTAKIGDLQVSNAKIANGTIETAKIKDAAITTAKIQDAQITNAKIAAAGIDYANIKDVSAGTAIFTQGVGQTLYLGRLIVTDANFSSAIIGKLMIRDTDGKLYRINVASDGAVTATQVQVNGDTLTDNAVMSVSQRLLWRQATAPSAPWIGMLWHDTTLDQLKRCLDDDPLTWEIVPSGAVHTSVIDVDDTGMTVATSGILNLLSGASLTIKALGDTANIISMDNTGLTLSSTGQLKLQSTDSIIIGGSPFSVGGANLLTGTDNWVTGWDRISTPPSVIYVLTSASQYGHPKGSLAVDSTQGGGVAYAQQIIPCKPGDVVTLSAQYLSCGPGSRVSITEEKTAGGYHNVSWLTNTVKKITTTASEYAKQWIIQVVAESSSYIYVYQLKLEKGTIATDWSPSPQDTADALDALDGRLGTAETSLTGKTKIWYQSAIPVSTSIGDVWYKTDATPSVIVYRAESVGADAIASGEWVDITDSTLSKALTGLDILGKGVVQVFEGAALPTAADVMVGDMWLYTGTDTTTKKNGSMYRAVVTGADDLSEWTAFTAGAVITPYISLSANELHIDGAASLVVENSSNGNGITMNSTGMTIASGSKLAISATDLVISGKTVETYASDKIRLEVSVGVRNYYKRDQPFFFWSVPGSSPAMNVIREGYADCEYGFFVMGSNPASGSGMRISNVIDSNGWWTVSFDIRGTQSVAVICYVDICDEGGTQIVTTNDNTFKRVSVSVNVTTYGTNPAVYNFVDFENFDYAYFRIRNIKIEKGNKATDFIPANEDPASGVKTSYIDIATDHIDIATGGNLSLTGGNFNLTGGSGTKAIGMSTNRVDEYMMWAGDATPSAAPFSVKRDGSVKATKVQQEYSNSFWDMADGSTPAEFPVYIPSGYTIDSVTFTFKTNKARTFAKAASSGGAFTTPAGDWLTGGVKDSVSTGTPSANNTGSASPSVSGFSGGVGTGSAGDSAHTHGSGSYTAASHSHDPGSHTHTMGHQHSISAHTHEINAHSHGLNYGINEKTTLATSCVLTVGATTIGTYSPNPSAPVEIKAYMVAGWNTVTVAPNDDARIVAYAMVKLTPS